MLKLSANAPCPCGSHLKYKKCCKVFHNGAHPKTALLLMKSRYSAFVAGDYHYIMRTTHPENSDHTTDIKMWEISILEFCNKTEFKSLTILESHLEEETSTVTFKACLFQNSQDISFVEKSLFYKVNNQWLYHSGEFIS